MQCGDGHRMRSDLVDGGAASAETNPSIRTLLGCWDVLCSRASGVARASCGAASFCARWSLFLDIGWRGAHTVALLDARIHPTIHSNPVHHPLHPVLSVLCASFGLLPPPLSFELHRVAGLLTLLRSEQWLTSLPILRGRSFAIRRRSLRRAARPTAPSSRRSRST